MRRVMQIIVIAGILFFTTSCVKNENKSEIKNEINYENSRSNIIEIREKMFIGQVYDVYLNPDDYLGKRIKLEGIFLVQEDEELDETYRMVVRYGPGGCCGVDGLVGFEVRWEDINRQYPKSDSWVEAIGQVKLKNMYLYMDLLSLNVLAKRGAEYVNQ
jgi:uncharacterized membrane protein YcgQ (UPF0703/DUF1980 family)